MLNLDFKILDSLQWMKNPVTDEIFVFLSKLGDHALIWVILALCFIARKKYRRFGLYLLIALGIGFIIGNLFLKNIIARSRPSWIHDTLPLLIPNPTDYSFPSGHTMHSFIAATMAAILDKRWAVPVLVLAAAIGFSRIYLYVHFLTDVLGGALLGILIGVCMMKFYQRERSIKNEL